MVGRSKIVEITRNVPSLHEEDLRAADQELLLADAAIGAETVEIDPSLANLDPTSWESPDEWVDEEVSPPRSVRAIVLGTLLVALFAGWSGFWAYAYQTELLAPQSLPRIAELIALWAVPSSLIAIGWLLAMRLSSNEARRFGDVAALLRQESEALEQRIKTVNGEISLARSFLSENARELESVGRASAQRLTEAAEQLVTALADSDQKAKMLETVSSAAISNVDLLRNHLPVVTSAAKDATNQIGNAGNAANAQVQQLTETLRTMDEAMASAQSSMSGLEEKTAATTSHITNATEGAVAALAASTQENEGHVRAMLAEAQQQVAELEAKLKTAAEEVSTLGDANGALFEAQHRVLQANLAKIADAAAQQDSSINSLVARLDQSLQSSQVQLTDIGEDIGAKFDSQFARLNQTIAECEAKLGAMDNGASDRIAKLAFAVNALSESSNELTVNLSGNEERAASMVDNAERLMLAIDNVSRELGENIPASFKALERNVADSNSAIEKLRIESDDMANHSAAIMSRLGELDAVLARQRQAVELLLVDSGEALTVRQQQAETLGASLNATHSLIADVAATADEQLSGALQRVAEAAHEAANSSKAIVESELADIGARLSEQNKNLLSGAIDAQIANLGSAVNEAIARNIGLSEAAAERVNAQLASVSELTTNLEQRAANARAQFDGIDDEAFARRIALLTESLNSAAIDVAKILSNDVTDTAWAAYLKGDRGVFTRRAVRLLDSGEARIIASNYDEDAEFRDHVNRYIHDFESMMRVLLSTRDGNAIGVTLLSSDVGKLYVALAQAIDRLRN
jgi:hypothetical protein